MARTHPGQNDEVGQHKDEETNAYHESKTDEADRVWKTQREQKYGRNVQSSFKICGCKTCKSFCCDPDNSPPPDGSHPGQFPPQTTTPDEFRQEEG